MKKSKQITIAELVQEIWVRERVRVVIHRQAIKPCSNYRFSRALDHNHTIAHLRDRIHRRLFISGMANAEYTIVLGDGSINPRSDMHMRTARKSYK